MPEPLQQCVAWLHAYFHEPAAIPKLPLPALHHPIFQQGRYPRRSPSICQRAWLVSTHGPGPVMGQVATWGGIWLDRGRSTFKPRPHPAIVLVLAPDHIVLGKGNKMTQAGRLQADWLKGLNRNTSEW